MLIVESLLSSHFCKSQSFVEATAPASGTRHRSDVAAVFYAASAASLALWMVSLLGSILIYVFMARLCQILSNPYKQVSPTDMDSIKPLVDFIQLCLRISVILAFLAWMVQIAARFLYQTGWSEVVSFFLCFVLLVFFLIPLKRALALVKNK